jgi:hypothetical protein
MQATELRQQLCSAIMRQSLVMFEYSDLIRVVEPHRFGINSAGHEMLSGWLRAGYSRSDPAGGWRNYLLTDVSALQVLDAPFAGTRPGYVANDPRMREVFCELTPAPADAQAEGPYVVREPMSPRATTQEQPSGGAPHDPSTASGDASSIESPTRQPIHTPVEAARTRDGEIDPPEAAP